MIDDDKNHQIDDATFRAHLEDSPQFVRVSDQDDLLRLFANLGHDEDGYVVEPPCDGAHLEVADRQSEELAKGTLPMFERSGEFRVRQDGSREGAMVRFDLPGGLTYDEAQTRSDLQKMLAAMTATPPQDPEDRRRPPTVEQMQVSAAKELVDAGITRSVGAAMLFENPQTAAQCLMESAWQTTRAARIGAECVANAYARAGQPQHPVAAESFALAALYQQIEDATLKSVTDAKTTSAELVAVHKVTPLEAIQSLQFEDKLAPALMESFDRAKTPAQQWKAVAKAAESVGREAGFCLEVARAKPADREPERNMSEAVAELQDAVVHAQDEQSKCRVA